MQGVSQEMPGKPTMHESVYEMSNFRVKILHV